MNQDIEILELLEGDWQGLVQTMIEKEATTQTDSAWGQSLGRRISPAMLYAELEDLIISWRELLPSEWVSQNESRFITPSWRVQALVAHVASWASEILSQAQTLMRGEDFQYAIPYALSVIGPNEWNHQKVAERQGKTTAELLEEIVNATEAMQDIILTASEPELYQQADLPMSPSGDPQSRWKGNLASLVILRCSHDRWHIERIRQFKESLARMQS